MPKEKIKEIEVNEEIVVDSIEEKKEAVYVFVKEFKTSSKTYFKGEDCFQENENVIAYLLKNKTIKKK